MQSPFGVVVLELAGVCCCLSCGATVVIIPSELEVSHRCTCDVHETKASLVLLYAVSLLLLSAVDLSSMGRWRRS